MSITDITGQSTIRIGTGEQIGNGIEYEIHGANAIYFEANIVTRDLTSAEQEWCDETIRYSGDSMPDDVIEFTIPHPDELRHAIREQNLDAFEELGAVIRTAESRHTVLTELQQTLEESKLLTTKLSSGKGQLIDLPPEWDPEVDDSDRDALYGLALSREDSHLVDFRSVAGFDYNSFFAARARSLGVTEPNLKYSDLIALSVAGVPDWDYQRVLTAEIGPFTGKYHLQREDGEYVIPSEGIYRLTGDETSFKVQIHTVPDNVEQAVSELNTQSGTTKSESGESEDTTESTPVNDDSRDGAGFRVKVHKFLS
jgi:hypothetical protein